jgi:hypothetical protein
MALEAAYLTAQRAVEATLAEITDAAADHRD